MTAEAASHSSGSSPLAWALRLAVVGAAISCLAVWQQGWIASKAAHGAGEPQRPIRRGAAFVAPEPAPVESPVEAPVEEAVAEETAPAAAQPSAAEPTADAGEGTSLLAGGQGVSDLIDTEAYDEPPPPEMPVAAAEASTAAEAPVAVPEAPREDLPGTVEVAMASAAPAPTEQPAAAASADTETSATATAASPADFVPEVRDGHSILTIDNLASFEYREPADRGDAPPVPAYLQKLDGQPVVLRGFMMPVEVEGNDVKSFVLVGTQLACCYGVTPKMNEWVYVTMEPGTSSRYLPDLPVLVWGKLSVGEEMRREHVLSLFRMNSTRVDGPREWAKAGWSF